jgi:hypothetical protein
MQNVEPCPPTTTERALGFELAYQSRVAIDRIRFAIKQTECENLNTGMLREIGLQLLDALERLETAERHFQARSGHDIAAIDTSSSSVPVSNGSRRSRHQDR